MELRFPSIGKLITGKTGAARPSQNKAKVPASSERGVEDRAQIQNVDTSAVDMSRPGFLTKLRRHTSRSVLFGLVGIIGFNALAPPAAGSVLEHLEAKDRIELLSENHGLTSSQGQQVHKEMDFMGSGAIHYLANHGVKLHVTGTDAETAQLVFQKNAYTQVEQEDISAASSQVKSFREGLKDDERLGQLSQRVDSLRESQRDLVQQRMKDFSPPQVGGMMGGAMVMGGFFSGETLPDKVSSEGGPDSQLGGIFSGMMGGVPGSATMSDGTPDPMSELVDDIFQAETMLKAELNSRLSEAGLSSVARPASSVSSVFSVQNAVFLSGAQTDQEKAEVRDLIYEWNGDDLVQAQTESLAEQQKNLDSIKDPTAQKFMSQHLEELKNNPDGVMVSAHKGNFVIPNFRFARFEGHHGTESYRVPVDQDVERSVQGALGFYNWPSRTAQVDDAVLNPEHGEKVVVHELTHALDHVMREESPELHKNWHGRLVKAYEAAQAGKEEGREVNSNYGLTNPQEYIAEGVEALFKEPEHLKETDPALYSLSVELLQQANKEGTSSTRGRVQSIAIQFLQSKAVRHEEEPLRPVPNPYPTTTA